VEVQVLSRAPHHTRAGSSLILVLAQKPLQTGMIQKVIIPCAGLVTIFALGWVVGNVVHRPAPPPPPPKIQDTATLLHQIQNVSHLVTVKYVLEKLVVLEDTRWYGNNRVLLIAHGVVKAGIDLSTLQVQDMQFSDAGVVVRLPPPSITDVYLDERKTQVLERTTSIMRTFDTNLEQNARRQAVEELQRSATETGILSDAEERARLQLAHVFHRLGFVTVEFLPPAAPGRLAE
jgi:hypothetical protein